jgi:DNA gyrase/topoisomerase IV subunit B
MDTPAPAPEPLPMRLFIRQRPGMYIGGLDARAVRHMVDHIVLEQLDAPGVRPERVRCSLGSDGTYTIDVRGGEVAAVGPADFLPDSPDRVQWDRLLSLAIACALSERLDAEVVRDGRVWSQSFAAGLADGKVRAGASTEAPRVSVRYRPDRSLFKDVADRGFLALCGRAREWGAFYPHVRFTVEDESDGQRRDFHYPDGLLSLAREMEHEWFQSVRAHRAGGVWRCEMVAPNGDTAEAVFVRWPGEGRVHSFVNGRRTLLGGTHVRGLLNGLAEVAAAFGDDPDSPFLPYGDGPLDGLAVLLSVRLANPSYRLAYKDDLDDKGTAELVRMMVTTKLPAEIMRSRAPRS